MKRVAAMAAASIRALIVVGIVLGTWYPDAIHDHVGDATLASSVVDAARTVPVDAVLREVGGMELGVLLVRDPVSAVRVADMIVGGSLPSPWVAQTLPLNGYPADLLAGGSTQQLAIAGLEIERILLVAYEQSGNARYLDVAVTRTLQFASYEAAQVRNRSFLWNDHATAARIAVLCRLWSIVRSRPAFTVDERRTLLTLVQRSALRLTQPRLFTVRTNHGVMQNLALLQIAAAFPELPDTARCRALALERLHTQLRFYVSDEGVVLEHSAEYHLMGAELTAYAVRLARLNGIEPPAWLLEARQGSARVLGRLMRPDGSLPIFGNTNGGPGHAVPLPTSADEPIRFQVPPFVTPTAGAEVYPLSGYAIWWQGQEEDVASQTVVAWAKHDGHGHKHADEGSVLWWSGGVDWLSNTGYWPYDAPNESAAYSWSASNALHQVDESFGTMRATTLLASAHDDDERRFVDLVREDTDGKTFRREVLQLTADSLLVMDFASGPVGTVESFWTIDPALRLVAGPAHGTFVTTPSKDGRRLSIAYAGAPSPSAVVFRESEQPFAGWVVHDGRPLPTDALRIATSDGSTVRAQSFRILEMATDVPGNVVLTSGAVPERWRATLGGSASIVVTREGASIAIEAAGGSPVARLSLDRPSDITARTAALSDAYARAVSQYPPWRDLGSYRARIIFVTGVLYASSEFLLVVAVRLGYLSMRGSTAGRQRAVRRKVDIVSIALWLAVAAWIFLRYLA